MPVLILLCFALLLPTTATSYGPAKTYRVVATVGQLADLINEVGGNRVNVGSLMAPGVDPHLYRASASDIATLQKADVIFLIGLKLEGKMDAIFSKLEKRKTVVAVGDRLDKAKLLSPKNYVGAFDPHVWFDVTLWRDATDIVAKALSDFDSEAARYYQSRAEAYKTKLESLHKWVLNRVAEVTKEKRILVTSHDAFNYFGRTYGFQVVGLQGISTQTEAGAADVAKLVDFIKSKKIKSIFVESSVSKKAIETVSRDSGVQIGAELFSDSMGIPGSIHKDYDVGTYEGMVRFNVDAIVDHLR